MSRPGAHARRALELPIDEQLELAQTLWEHASPPADSTLTPELKVLLESRYRKAQANPEAGISWEEMKARLLRRTMRIVLRPFVERDLEEVASWYEERQPGLKESFLEAVESTLSRIQDNPRLYPATDANNSVSP